MTSRWMSGLIGLGIFVMAAAPALADELASSVTPEYVQSYDARGLLRAGELTNRFDDFDLATTFYDRVIKDFPNARWAQQAHQGLAQIKADAAQHLSGWDPSVGGTRAGVQAQRLLHAGDIAYGVHDYLLALKFYERSTRAAEGSRYAARASAKARWSRFWHNPGP